jgi:hypothetical protein
MRHIKRLLDGIVRDAMVEVAGGTNSPNNTTFIYLHQPAAGHLEAIKRKSVVNCLELQISKGAGRCELPIANAVQHSDHDFGARALPNVRRRRLQAV